MLFKNLTLSPIFGSFLRHFDMGRVVNLCRYTMNEDFTMVAEQVLFPMILLDLLPPAKVLIGGVLALGVCYFRALRPNLYRCPLQL